MTHVEPLIIGRFEVGVVCQGYAPLDLADECPGHTVDWAAERARHAWAFLDGASWPWHVHAFCVRGPGYLAMVDTGTGAFPPFRPWAEAGDHTAEHALVAAGVDPDEVGLVVVTHLHADHAGGVWRGDGPRFPNARHVVHEADIAHFLADPDPDGYSAADDIERVREAGLLDAEPADRELAPGLTIVHTPGHTPGHRSVVLDGQAVLTGDLLHMPVQAEHPDWPSSHDVDPELGAASRRRLMTEASARRWVVGVPHLARPFGRVGETGWCSLGPVSAEADAPLTHGYDLG